MASYRDNPQIIEDKAKEAYKLLKELAEVDDFPAITYNARRALGVVWQMVNDLNLEFEQLFHLKV